VNRAATNGASDARAARPAAPVWLLAALLIVAPLLFDGSMRDATFVPKAIVIVLFGFGALLAFFAIGSRADHLRVPRTPLDLPLLLPLAWMALSLVWSLDVYAGLRTTLHLGSCAVIALVTAWTAADEAGRRLLLRVVALSACLVAALGEAQHLFGLDWPKQGVPPAATFLNRNLAAQFCAVAAPTLVYSLLDDDARVRWAGGAGAGFVAAYAFHTGTRALWLAGAVQLVVAIAWLALQPSARARARLAARQLALAAVAFLVLANAGSDGWRWRLGGAARHAASAVAPADGAQAQAPAPDARAGRSLAERVAMWSIAGKMLGDHPLGVGVGGYRVHYLPYAKDVPDAPFDERRRAYYAHNDALQLAAELGLVGAALLAWLLFVIGRAVVRRARDDDDGDDGGRLALVATLCFAGYAVEATFTFPTYSAAPPLCAAILLGLVVARDAAGLEPRGWSRRVGIALTAAVAYAWFMLAGLSWFELQHQRHDLAGRQHDVDREPEAAAAAYADAVAANRWDSKTLERYGRVLGLRGDAEEAETLLRRALAIDPWEPSARFNLVGALMKRRAFEEAEALARESVERTPGWPAHYEQLAKVLVTTGRPDEARAVMEEALRAHPQLRRSPTTQRLLQQLGAR
jgi:O-antigen ligase